MHQARLITLSIGIYLFIGIYLDLQKTFDTVNHDILLHKLHNYRIRGVALDWLRNYLSERYQFLSFSFHYYSSFLTFSVFFLF